MKSITNEVIATTTEAFEAFIVFTRPGWLHFFEKNAEGNYENEITQKLFSAWVAGHMQVGLEGFKVLMEEEPRALTDWTVDYSDQKTFANNRVQRAYWCYQIAKSGIDLSEAQIGSIVGPVLSGVIAQKRESKK